MAFLMIAFACNNTVNNQQKLADNTRDSLQKIAGTIISKTFDTLKATLTRTIADSGLEKAISICNTNAAILEKTYSNQDISLRRVSTKFRNNNNAPDVLEAEWLRSYASGDSISLTGKTHIDASKNEFHFYKPIIVAPLCLSCHGTPQKDIPDEVFSKINLLYPNDKATGYKKDDLRGIWHVVIKYKQ